jgi:long-chain acyl-CoA synthetase
MNRKLDEELYQMYESSPEEPMFWWNGKWLSRKDVNGLVSSYEEKLRGAGFKPGYRIATLMPNCPALMALSIACWRLDGAVVPLNLTDRGESLIKYLTHAEPFAVIAPDLPGKSSIDQSSFPFPLVKVPLEGSVPSFQGTAVKPGRPDTAVMFYTSGTTGFPKAVPLSHSNIGSNVFASIEQFEGLDIDKDIILNALPNFHALGFVASGVLAMLAGMKQLILPNFMPPETTLQAMVHSGANFVIAVPAMISFLVAAAARGAEVPPNLKDLISGGDRFPVDLDTRVQRLLGVGVCEGYGLTECSPVVAVNPSVTGRKLGSVGPVLPGFEYEVRDDGGQVLGKNEEGILWLRGPSVTSGYFRDPGNTAEKFKNGWFNTGDIVTVDEDGYISIKERASDLVIVGGFNVYPQEVELVLNSHPKVRESAVVGIHHTVSGQIVKAFVIKQEKDVSSRELMNYCKERLAHYKTPRVIEFVEDFPRNSLGKVLRRKLRDW